MNKRGTGQCHHHGCSSRNVFNTRRKRMQAHAQRTFPSSFLSQRPSSSDVRSAQLFSLARPDFFLFLFWRTSVSSTATAWRESSELTRPNARSAPLSRGSARSPAGCVIIWLGFRRISPSSSERSRSLRVVFAAAVDLARGGACRAKQLLYDFFLRSTPPPADISIRVFFFIARGVPPCCACAVVLRPGSARLERWGRSSDGRSKSSQIGDLGRQQHLHPSAQDSRFPLRTSRAYYRPGI